MFNIAVTASGMVALFTSPSDLNILPNNAGKVNVNVPIIMIVP